jgi:hypothetical protein
LTSTPSRSCFVAVGHFIALAVQQDLAQGVQLWVSFKVTYLLTVMLIHEPLYGFDGAVHRARTQQSGQGACEKSGQSPDGQKAAVPFFRQPCLNFVQVGLFGLQMALGKSTQRWVARDAQNTLVNANGADFARVIGPQVGHHLGGQGAVQGHADATELPAWHQTRHRLWRCCRTRHR